MLVANLVFKVVYDQSTHALWMENYDECGSQVAAVGRSAGDVGRTRGLC